VKEIVTNNLWLEDPHEMTDFLETWIKSRKLEEKILHFMT
jgi:hypothetical protein